MIPYTNITDNKPFYNFIKFFFNELIKIKRGQINIKRSQKN